MYLEWELCDRNQKVLARLDNRRPGASVTIPLNGGRTATVPLALDDPAVSSLNPLSTVLRVTLKDRDGFSQPIFVGRVQLPERQSTPDQQGVTVAAADPWRQFEKFLIRYEILVPTYFTGPGLGPAYTLQPFVNRDQSEIMWLLIEGAQEPESIDRDHGVVKGDLPESVKRDRSYSPLTNLAEALLQMSQVIGGPDFELAPVVANDGTLCEFNTFYPRQGSDKSAEIVFVHGASPSTATEFVYAAGGDNVCNRCVAIGAPFEGYSEGEEVEGEGQATELRPGYVAEHPASIADLGGVFEEVLAYDTVIDPATLGEHAKAHVAANAYPIPFFDFASALSPTEGEPLDGDGVPPRFLIDYGIGDTIAVEDHRPDGSVVTVTGRVTDATITENASGQLAVKLTCAPKLDSAGVEGHALDVYVLSQEVST